MIRVVVLILCAVLSYPAFGSEGEGSLVNDPPQGISIPDIIQRFAAKEKEFQQAREKYSYTQDVAVAASCQGGQPGVYRRIVDVTFDDKGNPSERQKSADSTLSCIAITKQDLEGFRNQFLFLLTPDEIPSYQIDFVGQQKQDNLPFFVFDVSPLNAQPDKQYFEGRIWVDGRDFLIVKTRGSIMTKKKKKGEENLFPAMTIWRQQIDDHYWFPAYGRANDTVHFSTGDVQVNELVKFTNYKAK